MAGAPGFGPMQLSPDGRWRWDGARWEPAQPQRTSRRRSWLWVLAACSAVLVLAALGGGYWIYSFVQGVKNGSNTCLPSDFPRYPGAVYAGFTYELNGAYPGNTCHAVFDSNDDVAAVTAFYQSRLKSGAWQVTASSNQAKNITFQPVERSAPFGTIQVAAKNAQTEITIDLFTSTCLPLNFPMYPGAKFGGQSEDVGASTRSACHVVFVSAAKVAAVAAFYERQLNTGNWQVMSSADNRIGFRLRSGKRTLASGTVTISDSNERTEISIDAYP